MTSTSDRPVPLTLGTAPSAPASLDIEELRKDPDTLVIDHAGEVLFRLASERDGAEGQAK